MVVDMKKLITIGMIGGVCLLGLSNLALADKKVYSPFVEKGEFEVETTGVYDVDAKKEKNAVPVKLSNPPLSRLSAPVESATTWLLYSTSAPPKTRSQK